jgi:CubicO group peptidase (beta-lactamase class C family)
MTRIFLPFLLLLTHITFAQTHMIHQVDSIASLTVPRPLNGVVMIAEKGKIIYRKVSGYADISTKRAIKEDDRFILGSISKQITAVLILQEMEQGRLDLHAPIRRYLPDLKDSWADSVTTHQLLNHTSGVVNAGKPLAFAPGTKFAYGNYTYALLGKIVEKSSGLSYAELLAKLFRKCGMQHSGIGLQAIHNYSEQPDGTLLEEPGTVPASFIPAAGVMSTAGDLIKWNECLHNGKLLSDSAYRLMTQRSSVRPNARTGDVGYGYGVQIDERPGAFAISHGGTMYAFTTTVMYFPASATSLVIVENITRGGEDQDKVYFMHEAIREFLKAAL